MKAFETSKGSKVIRLDNVACACFLIITSGKVLMVDTGIVNQRKKLEAQMCQVGIEKLDYIIHTHHHTDHTQNTAYFQRKFGCPVYIDASECDYLLQGKCKLPKGTGPAASVICGFQSFFHIFEHFEPVEKVISINYDDSTFPDSITVLATPGHTCGSVSILVDDEIACVGDSMMNSGKSIYPSFADDEMKLLETWKVLAGTSCTTFLPAHGGEFSKETLEEQLQARIK